MITDMKALRIAVTESEVMYVNINISRLDTRIDQLPLFNNSALRQNSYLVDHMQ